MLSAKMSKKDRMSLFGGGTSRFSVGSKSQISELPGITSASNNQMHSTMNNTGELMNNRKSKSKVNTAGGSLRVT